MKITRRWFLGVAALAPLIAKAHFNERDEIEIDEAPALPPDPDALDTLVSWSAYGYAPFSEWCVVRVFAGDRLFYESGMNACGQLIRYVPPFELMPSGRFTMQCDSSNVQLEMCLRRGNRSLIATRRPGMANFLTLDIDSMQVERQRVDWTSTPREP